MCATDPVDREERRDDEELIENLDRLQLLNAKEGFDLFRLKESVLFAEYLRDRKGERERQSADAEQARRHTEEMFSQRMRFAEETFATRQRGSEQSTAHRDLAIAQQWRDQGRDSGESVFVPKQSS